MNKFLSTAAILLISLAPYSPSLATQPGPSDEPMTGITIGRDPEWSANHIAYHSAEEFHVSYHAQKDAQHKRWHELNMESVISSSYEDMHRRLHERMNAIHREMHLIATEYGAHAPVGVFRDVLAGFFTVRPSRRALRAGVAAEYERLAKSALRPLRALSIEMPVK